MSDYDNICKQFMYLTEKLSQTKRKSYNFGDGIDLYKSEIHTIDIIGHYHGIHVSEIARKFGVTKGAVSQILMKLEKKELIEKSPDKTNNTRVLINLTDKGRFVYNKHIEMHEIQDKKLFNYLSTLNEHDMQVIMSFLVEANEMCVNHI